MFDIAFSELIVVGIVALIVIGPEKLPKLARTAGLLMGRAQRYVNDIKSDISNELRFEEIQKLQNEILKNTQEGSTQYQVGQVIKHEMEQAVSPKYQVGQVIHHEAEHQEKVNTEQVLSIPTTDITPPSPIKVSTLN